MKKVYGGIVGLAIGDALGVPVEFKSRQEIAKNPVISMREYGTHNQPMGTWSDDTSLTLALIDSIIEKDKLVYKDIMNRLSSALTHRHPISLIACGIYINIALQLLTTKESLYTCIEQGINEGFEYYDDKIYDEVVNYMCLRDLSNFSNLSEEEIRSSGYVVDTLEAAIWCLLNTNSF